MTRPPPRPTRRRRAGPVLAVLAAAVVLGAGALLLDDGSAGRSDAPGRGAGPGPAGVDAPFHGAAAAGAPALPASATGGDAGPGVGDAEAHLAAGEDLATRNAPGAPHATRDGLLRAEAELRAALRLGCARPALVQRLLATTYAALAQEWAESDLERREYEGRARDAWREVVALSPGDAAARWEYAVALEDRRARIEEAREAARLAPRDPRPRRLLGEDLLEEGSAEEGARFLVEAAELAGRDELEADGIVILRLLRVHGRAEEEARVRDRLERLGL